MLVSLPHASLEIIKPLSLENFLPYLWVSPPILKLYHSRIWDSGTFFEQASFDEFVLFPSGTFSVTFLKFFTSLSKVSLQTF